MRFNIDAWWPAQSGDILYHDWGESGGTLLHVTNVFDPHFERIGDAIVACTVIHDWSGELGTILGGPTLIYGATLRLTYDDIVRLGRPVVLITRIKPR